MSKLIILAILILFFSLISPAFDIPPKVYLEVPFLCQAPYGDWGQPWQDACEEAAIIMAIHYIKGDQVNRESGYQEILDLVDFQIEKYGDHFDLTVKQSRQLVQDYYEFENAEVKYDITIQDIKNELAQKNIVVVPVYGRALGNPYYTRPGPVYHYILIKGYNDKTRKFITNDCGTRRGRNYRYKYNVLYKAIHDWAGSYSNILSGKKAMLVFKR